MTELKDKAITYVKVLDRLGREYVCPSGALKNPDNVTKEELINCFDSVGDAFSEAEVLAIIKSELHKD